LVPPKTSDVWQNTKQSGLTTKDEFSSLDSIEDHSLVVLKPVWRAFTTTLGNKSTIDCHGRHAHVAKWSRLMDRLEDQIQPAKTIRRPSIGTA
jgi:hypothetical protein